MRNCYNITMVSGRRSYTFKVLLRKSSFPSGERGYFAVVPELEHLGAASQGRTRDEALKNIREALSLVVEEFAATGERIPGAVQGTATGELITVTA